MKQELMTVHAGQAEYKLSASQPLRLVHAAGRRIACLSGTAWITAYGQRTDFMLRAGQSFEVPNDGLTLIEAVGQGRVRIEAPARAATQGHWAGRLLRRLRALGAATKPA